MQLQSAGMPESITPDRSHEVFLRLPRSKAAFRFARAPGTAAKKSGTQFYELSTGQQRRLALALAVAHDPQIVFLDEPTAGLDVASRVELHELMRDLQKNGTTIVLATHDMAEAEELSDRVAILLNGKLAAIGSPLQITSTGEGLTKISVNTRNGSLAAAAAFPAVQQSSVKEEYLVYYSTDIGSRSLPFSGISNRMPIRSSTCVSSALRSRTASWKSPAKGLRNERLQPPLFI